MQAIEYLNYKILIRMCMLTHTPTKLLKERKLTNF